MRTDPGRGGGRIPRRALIAGAVVLGALGCSSGEPEAEAEPEVRPRELIVAAASDLTDAMPELASAFGRRSGLRVVPVLGSSGQLARQIEQGAPFDVFLSADRGYVRRLAEAGAIEPASVRSYAIGPVALVFAESFDPGRSGLETLADPAVRTIALANPDHAPYGRAARQALERAGLWDEVEAKVVYGQSIREAATFVASGQAEAGLIARSLTSYPGLRRVPIDPSLHDPVVQALGVVSGRPARDQAEAFCALLVGEDGQAILRRFGFQPPDGQEGG